ncbi:MAG: hypothetical protein ABI130_13930 [Leifsonia sp.]
MPAAPVPDLFARVEALNDPSAPYVFTAEGNSITGRWNFDNAALAEELGDGGASPNFRYVVNLDPQHGTFRCVEEDAGYNNGEVRAYRGYNRNYNGNLLSLIVSLAQRADRKRRTGDATPAHRYRQEDLKTPVRTLLEESGWQRKGLIK